MNRISYSPIQLSFPLSYKISINTINWIPCASLIKLKTGFRAFSVGPLYTDVSKCSTSPSKQNKNFKLSHMCFDGLRKRAIAKCGIVLVIERVNKCNWHFFISLWWSDIQRHGNWLTCDSKSDRQRHLWWKIVCKDLWFHCECVLILKRIINPYVNLSRN